MRTNPMEVLACCMAGPEIVVHDFQFGHSMAISIHLGATELDLPVTITSPASMRVFVHDLGS